MALIKCPQCQKEISDKAKICPACGFEMPKPQNNFCTECGRPLPPGATECANCGCPVETDIASVQQVEVTLNKKSKKSIVTCIVLLVAIAAAGTLFGVKYQAYKYNNTLRNTISLIATSAVETEEAGGLIHDVWYNTVFEISDSETDKYTKTKNKFNDDFNDSFDKLYNDSEFTSKITSIQKDRETIIANMKTLTNPPAKYKEAYSSLKTLYTDYMTFSDLVINAEGTLFTFTDEYNDADEKLSKDFEKINLFY